MKRKAVSLLISTAIITLTLIVSIGLVLSFGTPVIDRAKESSVVNEALQNMITINNVVKQVASGSVGSFQSVNAKFSEGSLIVDSDSSTIEYVFDAKTNVIEAGSFVKQGDVLVFGAGKADAIQNSTHLILSNEGMEVVFPKIGSETVFDSINTSTAIKTIKIKALGATIVPNDTIAGIQVENYTNSSYGIGYSKLVREGSDLPRAEVVFHILSNLTTSEYEVLYTLPSQSDFLLITLKNLTGNQTSIQYGARIGSTLDSLVKIGSFNLTNASTGCYNVTQINKYYLCSYDSSEYSSNAASGLVYLGSSDNLVKMCFSNSTSLFNNFNLTANGNTKALVFFSRSDCGPLDARYSAIQRQELPSFAFGTYAGTSSGVKVDMVLQFDRIKLQNSDIFGKGIQKICINKVGEERFNALVNVTAC